MGDVIVVVPAVALAHAMASYILFDSKPKQSCPMRVLDITGKLWMFDSKPQQSHPKRPQDIMDKLRHWWQLCKRASMGHARQCQNSLKRKFFAKKVITRGLNLNTMVDTWQFTFSCKHSMLKRWSLLKSMEHYLREEQSKRMNCVSRAIIKSSGWMVKCQWICGS